MRHGTSYAPLTLPALLLASFGACHVTNYKDTHCSNNDGDEFCRREHPDYSLPYCSFDCEPDVFDGCVEAEPEPSCYSACGGRLPLTEDPTCEPEPPPEGTTGTGTGTETDPTLGETESSDSGESTTGPMPCQGNDDCTEDGAPFCEPTSGECVACDGTTDPDGACAALDPAAPLCVGGACVQCTATNPAACTGETPICDDASNTCVPCTAHDQCGEAACNLFTGACLPADAVVHVGGATPDFPSLTMAVASFDPMTEGTIVVHAGDYNESVPVDGGRVLAFLAAEIGAGVEPPRWIRSSGNTPQITVTDATVLMDGMQVSGNVSTMVPGLRIDAGRAWLDRSRVIANLGGGVLAENSAEIRLRNCFVGGDVSDRQAFEVNGATASVLYTTLGAGFGSATALVCDGTATVDIRNALLVARTDADELQCSRATIEFSAAEASLGGTNTTLGTMQTSWFADYGGGDFHLATAPATIGNAAEWTMGDPLTDIDAEPRPALDGAPDAAGADVP
jgi:hypothetical protein